MKLQKRFLIILAVLAMLVIACAVLLPANITEYNDCEGWAVKAKPSIVYALRPARRYVPIGQNIRPSSSGDWEGYEGECQRYCVTIKWQMQKWSFRKWRWVNVGCSFVKRYGGKICYDVSCIPTPTPTPTDIPPTVTPTDIPPTVTPTEIPPTEIPPTEVPPTEIPPTEIPPTPTPIPPQPVFYMYLLTRNNDVYPYSHTACMAVSNEGQLPCVEWQKANCFPTIFPNWIAENAPCGGWMYDNDIWECDGALKEYCPGINRLSINEIKENIKHVHDWD